MVDALEIGYAVKHRRAQLGLTQEQVAQAAGVSKRFLWSLELGESSGVRLDKLAAVLSALGLDLVLAEGEAPSISAPSGREAAVGVAPAPSQGAAQSEALAPRAAAAAPIDALAILTGGKR